MKVIAVTLGFSSNLLIVALGTCVTRIRDDELFSMNNSETQSDQIDGFVWFLILSRVQNKSDFIMEVNSFMQSILKYALENKKLKCFKRLLEVWFYMNGPSKLAAPISSKQLFRVQLCF